MKQAKKCKTAAKSSGRMRLAVSMLAMTLSSMTLPANAETSFNSTLSKVWSLADGRIILQPSVNNTQCSDTGSPKSYWMATGPAPLMSADGLKNTLAVAMAGIAMGKTFAIYFDETSPYCYITKLVLID